MYSILYVFVVTVAASHASPKPTVASFKLFCGYDGFVISSLDHDTDCFILVAVVATIQRHCCHLYYYCYYVCFHRSL